VQKILSVIHKRMFSVVYTFGNKKCH